MRGGISIAAALLALALGACASGAGQEEALSRLDTSILPLGAPADAAPESVASRMAFYHVPGLSIAVIRDGRIVWARGYGVRRADSADAVDAQTLFQAASISKPVVAAATLRLVEQGHLYLDRDVNRELKSWRIPPGRIASGHSVTVAELLSHRAGLTILGFAGYQEGRRLPNLKQILDGRPPANSKPVRLRWRPGAEFHYSGGGYEVLQQLLTDATAEPLPLVAEQQVLGPLMMTRSGYWQPLPADLWSNAAVAHDAAGNPVKGRAHVYPELAAAGLWTTPADVARFAIALSSAWSDRPSALMSPETARLMLTRQGNGPTGLGVFLDGEGSALRFHHPGDNFGYHAQLVAYADGRFGAVAMTNGEGGRPLVAEIINTIAKLEGWPDFTPLGPE